MVDYDIYYVEIVDSIRKNQKIGDTPNYCIPLTINAITVQGISYSDPLFSSFKLNYKMALGAPEYMNKSDYAFKSSVCMKRVEVSTNSMRPLNEKSVKKHCEMNSETRMITNEDDSERIHHDNNVLKSESSSKMLRSFTNGDLTFDALLELSHDQEKITRVMCERQGCDGWGTPRALRLCGGGETSLNSAAGWGSPPAPSSNAGNWSGSGAQSNPPNNTQPQWNNANQRPPTCQSDNAANSTNANNGGNSPNSPANAPGGNGANGNNANNTSSAKIEQLNSMREALFSQDGWGGQHVNQDTNWDVPGSPEPGSKVEPTAGGPPAWKPNINNGTDLWEANLRNGGQPPAQPASKTPWGHTPTTNIGGTWGEDDDAGDSASVWSGPPPQQWPAGPPQQQHWNAPKKDDWNTWGEPHRSSDPRLDSHRSQDPRAPPTDPRHDPRNEMRGISGRLNGEMWGQHVQQHTNKMMPGGGINQWNSQGPKDSMKSSGWEEPSPPAARRSASGFDDGTSLWAQRGGVGGGMPGRGGPQGPPSQQRMPPTPTKPDAVWGSHAPRNGAWEEAHTPSWSDRDVGGWPDAGGPGLWPSKHKPSGPSGAWPDDIGEWGGPKHPPGGPLTKQLPKDVVWNSKQFRYLVELGYKKEDVDSALRRCDMNAEDALELLAAAARGDWRGNDHFHHAGFPPSGAPAVSPGVQKLLSQPPPVHPSYGNGGPPSAAQLRMLVQQIQMAVTTGYLNHQILNQPLAPQTLVLLNQLLQQIKALQQLVQQHTLAATKGNTNLAVQCSVQISKAKQQISALQGQISTQQALYMKQQAGTDLFKPNHDPISQLQNNFADMAMNKDPQTGYAGSSNQQSRLNQWKLPSLDKDSESSEFSRAPGTAKSTTSPHLGQLGLQPDSTWGVDRSGAGQGWGDGSDVADGKDTWPSHQPVYDLVPEFEPGKPWKGNQMKSAEDDPAMTPGSVVRSPLSLVAIKDSDILGGKTSPPSGSERSLSSSTWSYAPPSSTNAVLKPPADAWGGGKARGAAPQALNKPWPQHHNANNRQVPTWQASSNWLLLKNLTAQIDGSTLKTLCVQHGPLQNFHLYLNQGVALARYSTREEAAKAQMALNNCVLSNTTIFAESPADSDVQILLQHLAAAAGGGWRGKEPAWNSFPSMWTTEPEQRSTPSLSTYLPPDLLGGESI